MAPEHVFCDCSAIWDRNSARDPKPPNVNRALEGFYTTGLIVPHLFLVNFQWTHMRLFCRWGLLRGFKTRIHQHSSSQDFCFQNFLQQWILLMEAVLIIVIKLFFYEKKKIPIQVFLVVLKAPLEEYSMCIV